MAQSQFHRQWTARRMTKRHTGGNSEFLEHFFQPIGANIEACIRKGTERRPAKTWEVQPNQAEFRL